MVIDNLKRILGIGDLDPHERVNRRAQVPTVLQMEAVECGAAALSMVMGYHGRHEPLEELRVECGVSRDGSKASNVLKAARSYGFEAKGYKKQPEDLLDMEFPVILFWNFNHFVVLEGFKNGKVYINDPASGPKVISWEELDNAFTGVVLTFEPTDEFEPGGSRRSMIGSLLKRLSNSKLALAYVVLAGLFLVIPGLVIPIFSKIFVDQYLVGEMNSWIRPLLIGMGVTAVIHAGLSWLQQRFLLRMQTQLAIAEASRFLWHVLRLPVEFFKSRYAGDVASRVNLNDQVARMISERLVKTLVNCFTIIFYAFLMFYYDVVLTLIGIGMVSINVLALRYVQRSKTDASRRLKKESGKLQGVAMNGLRSIETLKSTGGEDDFFSKWAGHNAKVLNYRQDLASQTRVLNTVPTTLQSITIALILGIGGLRVMGGHITMGMLVAFQSLTTSFLQPVQTLVTMGSDLQDLKGDMERLDDVYRYDLDPLFQEDENEENETDDEPGPSVDPVREDDLGDTIKLSGRLNVRDLRFGYNPLDEPLIQEFNLSMEPGSRVALVGPSGCGKSTLAKLITGLFQPWDGEIRFDGRPRNDHSREVLNHSLSFVDQNISLFQGTIRENLTLWDSTVPDRDIIAAAKDACIHEAIAERSEGYDSHLKEGGANFSGGQRQRLEIARALVQNPTFLVLDEATSALDPTTEERIDDNIRKRGCSTLIIAHRLSTIRDCDEIIVLRHGRITERGTHEDLVESSGLYERLIKSEGVGEEPVS